MMGFYETILFAIKCVVVTILGYLVLISVISLAEASEAELRRDDMLYPTVRLHSEVSGGLGTGVVIESNEHSSTIITNAHVALMNGGNPIFAMFVGDTEKYTTTVLRTHVGVDLALMTVNSGSRTVVRISNKRFIDRMEKVYSCGAGAGLPIHMTEGYTSITSPEDHRIMFTAPIVGGNSGGGIYIRTKKHYELVGISAQVMQTGAKVMSPRGQTVFQAAVPVYHLGFAVDIDTVHKFLDGELETYVEEVVIIPIEDEDFDSIN
jgi:S1-C subfamily serine protease